MNFAVEKVTTPVRYTTVENTTITRIQRNVVRTSPRTGDTTTILAFCGIALVSGLVLLFLGIGLYKKNRR